MKAVRSLLSVAASLHAGPRRSTNYTISTDTPDAGGKRGTSAAYSRGGSLGGVTGVSTVAAPAATAKHGYIGQLYDVLGLLLAASPSAVNEGAATQLALWQVLDDLTQLGIPATSVNWSVLSGPLTGINASGLATAGAV